MKKIRTPFFEIGTKNYIYGDDVLKLAMKADELAEKYDIDVLLTTPYCDIRRVAENTKNIIIKLPKAKHKENPENRERSNSLH